MPHQQRHRLPVSRAALIGLHFRNLDGPFPVSQPGEITGKSPLRPVQFRGEGLAALNTSAPVAHLRTAWATAPIAGALQSAALILLKAPRSGSNHLGKILVLHIGSEASRIP